MKFFSRASFDSAIGSGRLALISSELMGKISSVYLQFRYADSWSQKVFDTIQTVDLRRDPNLSKLAEFQSATDLVWVSLRKSIMPLIEDLRTEEK